MISLDEKIKAERKQQKRTIEANAKGLQRKISKHPGELIAVLTTHYGMMGVTAHTYNPDYYVMEAYLQTGILTPKTSISPNYREIVTGVKNPHVIDLDIGHDRDFEKLKGNRFVILDGYGHGCRSRVAPLECLIGVKPLTARSILSRLSNEEFDTDYMAKNNIRYRGGKPAAWIKIGNGEAIPFLQKALLSSRKSWRYVELSKLMEIDLPITDAVNVGRFFGTKSSIGKSIREDLIIDQYAIYMGLTEAEKRLPELKSAREELLKRADESDGLISDIAINVNYSEAIRDREAEIKRLIRMAMKRGYHESGFCIKTQLAPGVSKTMNFKEFFFEKKKQYEHLL